MLCYHSSRVAILQRLRPLTHTTRLTGRQFHASRPNLIINEIFQTTHTIFQTVHDVSNLPWGLSIPLTGVLYQLCLSPLHRLTNVNEKRTQIASAQLLAWRNVYRQKAAAQFPEGTRTAAIKAEAFVRDNLKAKNAALKQKYKYKGWWFNLIHFSYLPLWLASIRTLSFMAATDQPVHPTQPVFPDPTFKTEGIAWFPDLTVADPTFLLPIAQAAVFISFVFPVAYKAFGSRHEMNQTRTQKILLNTMTLYALAFGPMLIINEVSSGVVLYMLGSTTTAQLRRLYIRKYMGLNNPLRPAVPRRPVQK